MMGNDLLTLQELVNFALGFNESPEIVRQVLAQWRDKGMEFPVIKFGEHATGDIQRLLNTFFRPIGGDTQDLADQILHDKLDVKKIELIEKITSWFDSHGRFIQPEGIYAKDEDRSFYLNPVEPDYNGVHKLMTKYLPDFEFLPEEEFKKRCEAKQKELLAHPRVGQNAFERCVLAVPLPHVPQLADEKEIGAVMEIFMDAVVRAYGATKFPKSPKKRTFNNHRKGTLTGQTTFFPGVGQDEVIAAMAEGPQCGLLFTHPLQGYPVNSQWQVAALPQVREVFSLAGIEWPLVWIGHASFLGKDFQTPGNDVSALVGQSGMSFYFKASGGGAVFSGRGGLGYANGGCSGGFFCLAGSAGARA